MARPRRTDFEGGIHHVMNRGVAREPVFFSDHDRIEFGRRVADIHAEFGVQTLAYCLMGNHYHLLLRTPHGGLSAAMQRLGSIYTRHVNDRVGRDGPLFRGRFHSIVVTSDVYLLWVTRYIHLNPLDLPGVVSPREFRWSSYRPYLGLRQPPPFLDTSLVLNLFGGSIARFASFTEGDTTSAGWDNPHALRSLVEFAIARHDIVHGTGDVNPPWRTRTVLTLLAAHAPDPDIQAAAATANGFPSDAARRMALSRARHRLAVEPDLSVIVAAVLIELGYPPLPTAM